MVKYIQQEINLSFPDGNKRSYYKVDNPGNFSEKSFLRYIENNMARMDRSTVDAVLGQTMAALCNWFTTGRSVTVPHLGIFSLAIDVDKDKEMSPLDEEGTHRNAQSICVSGVNFKPSREFLDKLKEEIRLESSGVVRRVKHPDTNREERLDMLKEALKSKHYIKVVDYMRLAGLRRSFATKEIASFAADPESGITTEGRGTHKVYILNSNT